MHRRGRASSHMDILSGAGRTGERPIPQDLDFLRRAPPACFPLLIPLCKAMAKYDPLRDYLKRQRALEVEMSFVEIERKIGYMLPKSANLSQWWANPTDAKAIQAQHKAWGDAGYDAVLIAGSDRVRFQRVSSTR